MSLNPTPAERERAAELLDTLGQAQHPAAVLAWALAEARATGARPTERSETALDIARGIGERLKLPDDAEREVAIADEIGRVHRDAYRLGARALLEFLGPELLSSAQALVDSLEGDLGLARLLVERLADYGVES